METAKKHLSKGYDILGTIPVSGENVDRMALARQELRQAFAALEAAQDAKKTEQKEVSENG